MPDDIRVTLRLPPHVHQAIKESAEKSRRSLNSEIIFILEQSAQKDTENDK